MVEVSGSSEDEVEARPARHGCCCPSLRVNPPTFQDLAEALPSLLDGHRLGRLRRIPIWEPATRLDGDMARDRAIVAYILLTGGVSVSNR